jgi:lactate dehydrogenase-like 2-hydroxyacid dehydrogenase
MLLLGSDLKGKTLGIVGCGRIGTRVSEIMAHGAGMRVSYYDVAKNDLIEQAVGATYYDSVEKLLPECDVVSIHVPLLDSTRHLMNAERLRLMKKGSYLINTSRGAVIDEAALVDALKNGTIRAAALDVYEHEPALAEGLAALPNVIVTPHIASGSEETRSKMAEIAAQNVITCLSGEEPPNAVHI